MLLSPVLSSPCFLPLHSPSLSLFLLVLALILFPVPSSPLSAGLHCFQHHFPCLSMCSFQRRFLYGFLRPCHYSVGMKAGKNIQLFIR